MDLDTVTDFLPADHTAFEPGDAFLGGGTWLFSEPQPAVRRLLDLTSFGWSPATVDATGLTLAATCTLSELARLELPDEWPARALIPACCTALLGSFKVWHTATVGGNICLALAAAPMISLSAALDGVATLVAADGSNREVAVTDLVVGAGRTGLVPGEYLRSVFLPAHALACRTAFRQESLTPVGRSGALVIGRVDGAGATTITVTAATDRPYQLRFPTPPADQDAMAALDATVVRYYDDRHGSSSWRRAVTRLMVLDVVADLRR